MIPLRGGVALVGGAEIKIPMANPSRSCGTFFVSCNFYAIKLIKSYSASCLKKNKINFLRKKMKNQQRRECTRGARQR